eukprot:Skav234734  [mRNA]  locus=scaffold634:891967:892206:- [translate_table: standard]
MGFSVWGAALDDDQGVAVKSAVLANDDSITLPLMLYDANAEENHEPNSEVIICWAEARAGLPMDDRAEESGGRCWAYRE